MCTSRGEGNRSRLSTHVAEYTTIMSSNRWPLLSSPSISNSLSFHKEGLARGHAGGEGRLRYASMPMGDGDEAGVGEACAGRGG